jgi:hypothetical protein
MAVVTNFDPLRGQPCGSGDRTAITVDGSFHHGAEAAEYARGESGTRVIAVTKADTTVTTGTAATNVRQLPRNVIVHLVFVVRSRVTSDGRSLPIAGPGADAARFKCAVIFYGLALLIVATANSAFAFVDILTGAVGNSGMAQAVWSVARTRFSGTAFAACVHVPVIVLPSPPSVPSKTDCNSWIETCSVEPLSVTLVALKGVGYLPDANGCHRKVRQPAKIRRRRGILIY